MSSFTFCSLYSFFVSASKTIIMTGRSALFTDFQLMEIDPTSELSLSQGVIRKKERKLPIYPMSRVTFFPTLFIFVDCFLPACRGHQKYGVVVDENVPVMFKFHDFNEEPSYVAFKTIISKPIRVPLTGDVLINGIRWRYDPSTIINTVQCIFDCLIAGLKFKSLAQKICFECLFRYTGGLGNNLERFIRTVIYHVIPFGRHLDRDFFRPIRMYERGMNLRFRRVYWEDKTKMFKYCTVTTKGGVKDEVFFSIPGQIFPEYVTAPAYGYYLNPDLLFLRNIDLISYFDATTTCSCNSGNPVPIKAYIHLIRQHKRSDAISLILAQWDTEGYDHLWSWSLFGPDGVDKAVYSRNIAQPISGFCKECLSMKSVRIISVPDTTWLLMADIPFHLQKTPVNVFASVSSYIVNDVVFDLAFVVLYNLETGSFTSMHYYEDQWFYFDDMAGGIMKRCNPEKVKYFCRVNLRLFYLRRSETNPHSCLKFAAKSQALSATIKYVRP